MIAPNSSRKHDLIWLLSHHSRYSRASSKLFRCDCLLSLPSQWFPFRSLKLLPYSPLKTSPTSSLNLPSFHALNPPFLQPSFSPYQSAASKALKKSLIRSPQIAASLASQKTPPVLCLLSYLTFLSSTLPTWEDNSPARRASIIHVSPASSGLPLLNIVFIPSKYPLNLSFFHAKIALVIFFLHSFPSIRSTISTCMGAYLLSFLVHFLPYVLSSSNHLGSILQHMHIFANTCFQPSLFSPVMIPLVNFSTKI